MIWDSSFCSLSEYFWLCFKITVTVVDSGSKALEFLGFIEDNGQRNLDTSSDAPEGHQVKMSCTNK